MRCKVLLYLSWPLLAIFVSELGNAQQIQTIEKSSNFHCHALSRDNYTCGHCIQQHPDCAWCTKAGFDDDNKRSRCDTEERLLANGCLINQIENPKSSKPEFIRNLPLSNARETEDESDAIQMKPQEIRVTLRPKQMIEFPVTFRQAVDYPVDLYYLMDLSHSMEDDKQKLTSLGDLLSARMRQITKNFRLGFGSFVDKAVMPWVDPRPEKAKSPCQDCAEPYGYKNHMRLTKDTTQFKAQVSAAKVSGNLDAPEGGFDAILQALVCENDIGWREKSRKIIVFSTDAGFHYAGDGRLAGIVIPNDGHCHMDNRGYYSMSTVLVKDYPSIGQMHYVIKEKQANLIFAVTGEQVPLYTNLQSALPDISTTVGKLANDSSNIVELVQEQYNKISQKIVMQDNSSKADGLKMTYFTKCKGDRERENNTCEGIKVGDTITFRIQLEATHCGKQRDFVIAVGPAGLSEVTIIKVRLLCDCECENPKSRFYITNSRECNTRGDLSCGVCICRPPFIGRKCECDNPGMSTALLDAKCRKTDDPRTPLCEGRGTCECGICRCEVRRDKPEEVISGTFCECDNFNCPRHNRKICNGKGTCDCGTCRCQPGWTGDACECPLSTDSCVASNGKICNGRGTCECGVCKCYRDSQGVRYSGPTCEICPTCPDKCVEYKPCVMCQQFKTGPYNASQCAQCPFKVIEVEELPEIHNNKSTVACQFVDPDDDCTFFFAYDLDETYGNMTVWVKREKRCPEPIPVLAIVLGVIAGIVLIGLLLLLLWKLLTILHDRRELAKFEKERANAKWPAGENPLFHPATSTFQNPVYNGNKKYS